MGKVTFTSRSKSKMALLVQVAKEMGIKASEEHDIEDGDVVLYNGPKFVSLAVAS